jgi:hypothetical protein
MLHPDFWLRRAPDPAAVLLAPDAAADFNACIYSTLGIPPVLDLPDSLSAAEVRAQIAIYAPPSKTRYGITGEPLDTAYFEALLENASPILPDVVPVRFGLATRRTDVRSFPTDEVITSEPFQFEFDRIQETAIDTGTPLAVTAISRDGTWAFCLTPLYWGWVHAEHIAFGTREQVADYANAAPFVMTVASRRSVVLVTGGSVSTQMGTRLPLREEKPTAYRVSVPTRKLDGSLRLSDGFIAKRLEQFTTGYLPCTRQTIFTQAFSLLGEPYAWGDSRMGLFGRDCSRLIRDIHAVTGVILPRNADQQEKVCAPVVTFSAGMTDQERKTLLAGQVTPGAVLALPGHIMLYLGHVDGEPYVLHDTSANGFSSVIVSDLLLGSGSPAGSLLQRLSAAVMIG